MYYWRNIEFNFIITRPGYRETTTLHLNSSGVKMWPSCYSWKITWWGFPLAWIFKRNGRQKRGAKWTGNWCRYTKAKMYANVFKLFWNLNVLKSSVFEIVFESVHLDKTTFDQQNQLWILSRKTAYHLLQFCLGKEPKWPIAGRYFELWNIQFFIASLPKTSYTYSP